MLGTPPLRKSAESCCSRTQADVHAECIFFHPLPDLKALDGMDEPQPHSYDFTI